MKRLRKPMALLLALVLVLSCVAMVSAETSAPQQTEQRQNAAQEKQQPAEYADDEEIHAIVVLEGNSTAEPVSGISLFGFNSAPTEAQVLAEHASVLAQIEDEGIDYEVNFEYTALINGLSLTVEYGDLDAIAAIDGVKAVSVVHDYQRIDEDETPAGSQQAGHANELTGVSQLIASGYDGEGIVVAVLDSGIDPTHEAFLTNPSTTALDGNAAVETVGHGLVLSDKIPYYHDYYYQLNPSNNRGDAFKGTSSVYDSGGHGTKVAGLMAGYAEDEDGAVVYTGAAPQAQIVAMKVYSDTSTSLSYDVLLAALEDALKLDVDVINISSGWVFGFVEEDSKQNLIDINNIYTTLEASGIIVCASACNYYSMVEAEGYLDVDGGNPAYTDYGTIGNPATNAGVLAVAAAENSTYLSSAVMSVNGTMVPYIDQTTEADSPNGTFPQFVERMNGEPLDYVVIPGTGYGYEEDYDGVDVEGKVAVIRRGNDGRDIGEGVGYFSFATKIEMAKDHGAVAVIIYNNVSGDIYIGISPYKYAIPTVSISKETFEAHFANASSGTLIFPTEAVEINSSNAGRAVDMSSWGATPSLEIGPDIAGVGGNIRCPELGTENGYTVISGTSFSSPNMAGALATLLQYLKEQGYTDKVARAEAAKALVMSTATTLVSDNGVFYSPRKQGAGLYNLQAATNANAYIVDPIQNLYDDPSRSGTYTVKFTVQNISDTDQSYQIDVDLLHDQVVNGLNTLESEKMKRSSDYSVTCNSVTVPANQTATVELTINLTASAKAELNNLFENGTFIEGYVRLANENVLSDELHVTFMGYYGDWTDAPIFEPLDWRYWYTDDAVYNQQMLPDGWGSTAYAEEINKNRTYTAGGENYFYYAQGYDAGDDWNYNEDRFAFPTSLDHAYLNGIYTESTIVRNARHLVMVVSNAETGEVYSVNEKEYVRKTSYYSGYGWWSNTNFTYNGTDLNGNTLPDNTKVNVSFYANVDYGTDVLANVDWTKANLDDYSKYLQWTFSCTVDNEQPVVEDYLYDAETGLLKIVASDNQYVANIEVYGWADQSKTLLDNKLFYGSKGESCSVIFDISDFAADASDSDYIQIMVYDYATNYDDGDSQFYVNSYSDYDTVYTVTFDYGEDSYAYDLVRDGGTVTAPADPEGYTIQWYLDGVPYDFTQPVTEGITLTAVWTKDADQPEDPNLPIVPHPSTPSTSTPSTSAEPELPFTDVSENASYYDAIKYVYDHDLMNGTSDTKFSPSNTLTRGMVATILYRIEGTPAAAYTGKFADVAEGIWYTDGVEWAAKNGIVTGYTNGNFGPTDPVTREQLAAMLYRYAEYKGYDVTDAADLEAYIDSANVSEYAVPAVQWALANDILLSANSKIRPREDAIRAEVAVAVAAFHAQYVK